MLATPMSNTSNAEAPWLSVAITLTPIVPTSPFTGMPVKVRVAALKASHPGSGSPLASVAPSPMRSATSARTSSTRRGT